MPGHVRSGREGYALTAAPAPALFRGLPGCAFSFTLTGGGVFSPYQGWCVENGGAWFILLSGGAGGGREVLYTLDLAL